MFTRPQIWIGWDPPKKQKPTGHVGWKVVACGQGLHKWPPRRGIFRKVCEEEGVKQAGVFNGTLLALSSFKLTS